MTGQVTRGGVEGRGASCRLQRYSAGRHWRAWPAASPLFIPLHGLTRSRAIPAKAGRASARPRPHFAPWERSSRDSAAGEGGQCPFWGVQRGNPLCRGRWGCPPTSVRAGGWEEQRLPGAALSEPLPVRSDGTPRIRAAPTHADSASCRTKAASSSCASAGTGRAAGSRRRASSRCRSRYASGGCH